MKKHVLMAFFLLIFVQAAAGAPRSGAAGADDWRGFTVGFHFGGGWGTSDWNDNQYGYLGSHDPRGMLAGGQAGYNWQRGPWVVGVLADASWSGIDGSHLDEVWGNSGPAPEYNLGEIEYLGTLTGRVGHTWGPALVYARAGAAWARVRYALEGYYEPGLQFAAVRMTRWGWTVGLGLEYGLTERWSTSIEYDYLGFGTERAGLAYDSLPESTPTGPGVIPIDIRENMNVVKAGVHYRF